MLAMLTYCYADGVYGCAVRVMTPLQQALTQQEVEERIERAMFIDRMASGF